MRTFFFTYRVVATNHHGEIFIETNKQFLTRHDLKLVIQMLHGEDAEFNVLSLLDMTRNFSLNKIKDWSDSIKEIGSVAALGENYMILFG